MSSIAAGCADCFLLRWFLDSLGRSLELHIYDILVSRSSALSGAVDCFEIHQLSSPCDVFAVVGRFLSMFDCSSLCIGHAFHVC